MDPIFTYLREDWRRAREALQQQLDMFESGQMGLTLSAAQKQAVISGLKDGIAVYDGLFEAYRDA